MIIQDLETLKNYIPTIATNEAADFVKYETYLKSAEKWLRREITGADLFDLIEDPNTELVDFCSAVIAHKGYLEAIPFLDLVETANGFAVHSDTNLAPASTARVNALTAAMAARLDECVEDLLEYLESATEFHDDWKGSNTYTLINDNYIASLREFRSYAVFTGNRLDFIKARPQLTMVRRLKIEPVISATLSAQIIDQLRDDELSDHNKVLIEDLRSALAAYTTGDENTGNNFISRVKKVLFEKHVDYPLFEASEIYLKYLDSLTATGPAEGDPFLACGI